MSEMPTRIFHSWMQSSQRQPNALTVVQFRTLFILRPFLPLQWQISSFPRSEHSHTQDRPIHYTINFDCPMQLQEHPTTAAVHLFQCIAYIYIGFVCNAKVTSEQRAERWRWATTNAPEEKKEGKNKSKIIIFLFSVSANRIYCIRASVDRRMPE